MAFAPSFITPLRDPYHPSPYSLQCYNIYQRLLFFSRTLNEKVCHNINAFCTKSQFCPNPTKEAVWLKRIETDFAISQNCSILEKKAFPKSGFIETLSRYKYNAKLLRRIHKQFWLHLLTCTVESGPARTTVPVASCPGMKGGVAITFYILYWDDGQIRLIIEIKISLKLELPFHIFQLTCAISFHV